MMPPDTSVATYASLFERQVHKLKAARVEIPEPVLAFTFLENASLPEDKAAMIRSTATAITLEGFKRALSS